MFSRSFLSIVSILPLLWSISSSQSTSTACNNSPDLCNVSYGNITHLGAHDSPFVRDESNGFTTSGNQFYDSVAQLDAGVRLLSAQVHRTNGSDGNPAWHLCHTSCQLLDVGTLSDWLSTIKAWLDSNPNEVVTILLVNSDKASAETLAAEYQSAGIVPYVYTPASASPPQVWPTLNELISANTRLVSFVTNLPAASNAAAPYLMDEFAYVFETAFENFSPSDFNCTVDRPSTFSGDAGSAAIAAGLLPLKNHFLYDSQFFGIETPNTSNLNVTNSPGRTETGALGTEVAECASQWGRNPAFVLVDFFNVGPAIEAVDLLNGVQTPVGRTPVSEAVQVAKGGAGREGGSVFAVVVSVAVAVGFFGL